ncbi:MAG: hypothetical protein IPF99_34895 [Deltaproteobacteria bacterium]|nr:hypothetical protein [Deltaproteobacteria bacterium]
MVSPGLPLRWSRSTSRSPGPGPSIGASWTCTSSRRCPRCPKARCRSRARAPRPTLSYSWASSSRSPGGAAGAPSGTSPGSSCPSTTAASRPDRRVAEVGVAPRLWRLGLRENYRVFQGLDAIAVVVRMLSEGGGPYAAAEVDRALVAARTPRAYCVQYGETDLAFVRRLLEEEGVGFAFEHGSDGERMVLFDGEQLERLRPESVALALMGDGGATASEETLRALGSLSRLTTTRVSLGTGTRAPRAAW